MTSIARLLAAATALCALAAVPARAQSTADTGLVDAGRFIVYQGGTPVSTERFEYRRTGDSTVVTAITDLRTREADGSEKAFKKTMAVVVRSADFGLLATTPNARRLP